MLRTTNGGITFDSASLFWGYLKDMYFKDENTGVLVASTGGTFKTINAGLSWFRTQINLPTNQPTFRKVSFTSNDTGWTVGGDGRVFRTTDCGSNWDSISFLNTLPNVMYCSQFVNSTTGWVAGELGIIYKTTNTGQNWGQQTSSTNNLISSMWFYNNDTGWTSCGFGGILYTSNGGLTSIEQQGVLQNGFKLYQNFPNPFNLSTIINYELPIDGNVSIKIYDVAGRVVMDLLNENKPAGRYEVTFDGSNFTSGIYYYRIESGSFSQVRKMILIK